MAARNGDPKYIIIACLEAPLCLIHSFNYMLDSFANHNEYSRRKKIIILVSSHKIVVWSFSGS